MLRIFGCLLLSVIPVAWGWMRSRKILSEKAEIQGAIFMVSQFAQGIAYSQLPIEEIILQMPDGRYSIIAQLKEQMHGTTYPNQAWRIVASDIHCGQIKDIMRDLFNSLGKSDITSQIQICNMAIERLQHIQAHIDDEITVRSKLSRTIGLLVGAFIAIVLL